MQRTHPPRSLRPFLNERREIVVQREQRIIRQQIRIKLGRIDVPYRVSGFERRPDIHGRFDVLRSVKADDLRSAAG